MSLRRSPLRCQSRSRNELSQFAWYTAPPGALLLIYNPVQLPRGNYPGTADTVFFAPSAVVSFSFLPAPRPHIARADLFLPLSAEEHGSFWGWGVLWITLFIRGMWSQVVLLFVAARSSRGTAAVAAAGEAREGGSGPIARTFRAFRRTFQKSPLRTRRTPSARCMAEQCITTTRFDGHHPTDKIQRVSGPPGVAQKSASSTGGGPSGEFGDMNSPRAGPSHPRATGGTDGIQPAAGSPTTPGWCRPAHARAGVVVLGLVYRSPHQTLPAAPGPQSLH
jgi:hypothetical protein